MLRHVVSLFLLTATTAACNNGPEAPAGKDSIETVQPPPVVPEGNLPDSVREQWVKRLAARKDYTGALEQVNMLLQKDSANPAWLFMKADALEKKSDTTNAIRYFEQSIAEAGVFNEAEMRLANLYAETGHPKFLPLSEQLLRQPGTLAYRSDILLMKGIYYTRLYDHSRALAVYDQIIREDYSYLDAYIEKGLVYYDQKKYQPAYEVFRLSTTVKNSFADGYYWMAR
ncbi:MAG TPA: tetratricopeptide repeat protein, partial [Lacibacter sp.]|nr:tetratricopeptide repeat protein [Lacibacter sp.]